MLKQLKHPSGQVKTRRGSTGRSPRADAVALRAPCGAPLAPGAVPRRNHVFALRKRAVALCSCRHARLALVPVGTHSARFSEGARVTIFSDDIAGVYRRTGTILPLKASGHSLDLRAPESSVS